MPWRLRLVLVGLAAAVTAAVGLSAARVWRADSLRAGAAMTLTVPGADLSGARDRLERSARLHPHPETERLLADAAAQRGSLDEAARHLRRAIELDPYRVSNRDRLEGIERRARALAPVEGGR